MGPTDEIRRGTVLAGRYTVRKRLGAGGMATVFLAEDAKLGRDVAVKRLHTDAPKASLTRFEREAKLGAALNHPNLVSVYDTIVTDEGDALIVMEYVPGESLADIAARGPVAPDEALPILRSVGEALDHAHSQDVVHRDVKPANVLVRDDGFVKLADLGIARAVGATQLTGEGSVIGTLPYMSPERMRGPGAGGPPSDVYALAAVAYELLSGDPPADTASTEAMTDEQQAHFEQGLGFAPPGTAAVLQRGLDPNPRMRPTTATRLVEELDSALAGDLDVPTAAAAAPFGADPDETEDLTAPTERVGAEPTVRHTRRTSGAGSAKVGGTGRRGVAIIAVGAALATVAGLALAAGGGDDGGAGSAPPTAATGKDDTKAAQQKPEPEPEPVASTDSAPAPAPAPPVDGSSLNDQGLELIQAGDYAGAIPVLQRAVAALEGSGDELTYNYALFNLGQALRLGGRPEEAIPILQQRLAYPDQTEEVEKELKEAYKDAGLSPDGEEKGGPPGNAFGHGKGGPPGHEDD